MAFGQANSRAVFVSNNGNLEGSVSSFMINPDDSLSFVDRVITGTRPTTADPCSGCNSYEISLTPNGRYLATVHPAGAEDGLAIYEVASDATLSLVLLLTLPIGTDGPLDVQWMNDTLLAVALTTPSPDQLALYTFDPVAPSLTAGPSTGVAGSIGYLAVHPSGLTLYVNDTTNKAVRAYTLRGGALSLVDTESTGAPFPLELAVSNDGTKLYAAGGISDGGNKVVGMNIAPDRTLSPMAGTPFVSPGASPSNVFVSDSLSHLIVGHGTDATARTFSIDPVTGALTSTGNTFDVGLQGTLGDVRVLGDVVLITDNSTALDGLTGIYSFTLGAGGSLVSNGPIVLTNGIAPRSIAAWSPVLVAGDMDCDGDLDSDDVPAMALALTDPAAYASTHPGCDPSVGDFNGDTLLDGEDIALFVDALIP